MTRNNIDTRGARTDEEAWMLEKLNQEGNNIQNFTPREFLVSVNTETDERMAFGRTEYIRNVDDTEYVEINSFLLLDRADTEHGCVLVNDLAERALENDKNQVFTFLYENKDVFRDVGFEVVDRDQLPTVMREKFDRSVEKYGDEVVAMVAETSKVNFEFGSENDDEFNKPNNVTSEDVEKMKDELNIKDRNTKYQT